MPFNQKTPILYYKPEPPNKAYKRYEYFLYPVRMYRVVAPSISSRRVNILEKAILGMCRAGIIEIADISSHLEIHQDLTALIVSQLQDNNYIDLRGNITTKGNEILNRETSIIEESEAGFIFQDPCFGDLYPRFETKEEYANTQINSSGFPELIFGTTGAPVYKKVFLPVINNTIERKPSPIEIIEAVRQHQKTVKNLRVLADAQEQEDWYLEQFISIDSVTFIEDEPTELWLTACIYIPNSNLDDGRNSVHVYDPFGLGDSSFLFRKLEKYRREETIENINQFLANMLGAYRIQDFNVGSIFNYFDEEARLKVDTKLSSAIKKWNELYEELVTIERAYLEAEATRSESVVIDRIKNILINCQNASERVFKIIQLDYSTKDSGDILCNKKSDNQLTINQFSQQLGFNTPLPPRLLDVDRNPIKRAANYSNGSLRALILASILAAPEYSDHPLYSAATQYPNLLHLLDNLAGNRNAYAGHASSQGNISNLESVKGEIDTVYKLVSSTLGLSYTL